MATTRSSQRTAPLIPASVGAEGAADVNAARRILDAAVRAFDELGYEQATLNHVAKLAGTSKSLISYYFPNKRALAEAVVDLAYPDGLFMGCPRHNACPMDAIIDAAQHIAKSVVHSPVARVALALIDNEELGIRRASGRYLGWLVRFTDYFEEAQARQLIDSSVDTAAQARYVLSGIVGSITVDLATGSRFDLVDDATQLTKDRLDRLAIGLSSTGKR